VPATVQRRQFTAEYRRRILKEADACKKPGEVGALLRREGLYSSHLANWRRQREHGELVTGRARKRGPVAKPVDPRVKQLEGENRRLQRKLARAETIITLQKNHRARRVPRYLLDQKRPVRLSSQHPGGSGRLLFGDAAANP
jgi:transposase-like protein